MIPESYITAWRKQAPWQEGEQRSFLGKPHIKQKEHNNTIVYSILSEDDIPIKLKIEAKTNLLH